MFHKLISSIIIIIIIIIYLYMNECEEQMCIQGHLAIFNKIITLFRWRASILLSEGCWSSSSGLYV